MKIWEEYIAYDEPVIIPPEVEKMTDEEVDEYLKKLSPEVYEKVFGTQEK